MTHAPPQEECWLWMGIDVCTITPHEPHWSQQQWDDAHARNVAQDQQSFPPDP